MSKYLTQYQELMKQGTSNGMKLVGVIAGQMQVIVIINNVRTKINVDLNTNN